MGDVLPPAHGEAGHIPELFSPTISLIHWLARGRKDKSTGFDGSPFNGGARGEAPEGNHRGAFSKPDASQNESTARWPHECFLPADILKQSQDQWSHFIQARLLHHIFSCISQIIQNPSCIEYIIHWTDIGKVVSRELTRLTLHI